jgi:hypothetical protein
MNKKLYFLLAFWAFTPANADVPNVFSAGDSVSSSKINDNFQSLSNDISTVSDTVSNQANSNLVNNKFGYTYVKDELSVGQEFTILGQTFRIVEFEIASLLDHSIYIVKVPVKSILGSYLSAYNSTGVRVSGESVSYASSYANSVDLLDGYNAIFNGSTTVTYGAYTANGGYSTQSEFQSGGGLSTANIYETYITVNTQGGANVVCRSPEVNYSLGSGVSRVSVNHSTNYMNTYYTDSPSNGGVISSEIHTIISNCVNSNSYKRDVYEISTNINLSATILIDEKTTLQVSGAELDEDIFNRNIVDINPSDFNFAGKINVTADVPNPSERDVYRQQAFALFNHITITKQ